MGLLQAQAARFALIAVLKQASMTTGITASHWMLFLYASDATAVADRRLGPLQKRLPTPHLLRHLLQLPRDNAAHPLKHLSHRKHCPFLIRHMTSFDMATEKLTVIPPLVIRQTESLARDIQGLSDLHGMEKSEYIRHLVTQDKKRQQEIWAARNQLFADAEKGATNTAS